MDTFQLFKHSKELDKFGITGDPGPSRILPWKTLWKKEELKLKKMKMDIFKSFYKIASGYKFLSQKLQLFLIKKMQFVF